MHSVQSLASIKNTFLDLASRCFVARCLATDKPGRRATPSPARYDPYPWDSIQSGVCCPSLARPRQSVRGQPAQVDADAAAVSSAGSPKSCSAWLCEAPRIYAVLARLASRRWPAPAFRRPCSLGGLVAYPPHSVWLHGHDAPEQRQLGTQEPDANCQVQCRLTLLPTRTRRRPLPALHLQQRQRVSMG